MCKMTRTELKSELINEIDNFPTEIIEEMLRWALVIKKFTKPESIISSTLVEENNNSNSAGEALRAFLKKYESDSIDIDTSIFDDYRKSVVERDFRCED
jgi:wyosine [tRNA(Phe)-imidazoG37] synthetase (radical SAM superfamily)